MKIIITLIAAVLSMSSAAQAFEDFETDPTACGSWSCQVSCGDITAYGKNVTYVTVAASSATAASAMMQARKKCHETWNARRYRNPEVYFGKINQSPNGNVSVETASIVNDCIKD